jgi:hypothetical protein
LLQDAAPHEVVGYMHAPVPLQSVAPHAPPVQAAVQQRVPLPEGPHKPFEH